MFARVLNISLWLASIKLLKVSNKNIRRMCEIYIKLTIKTPELYCYLGTYFTTGSNVSIVNFEHLIAGWVFFFIDL